MTVILRTAIASLRSAGKACPVTIMPTEDLLPDGRIARIFVLHAPSGVVVHLTDLGATLMRIETPDRAGNMADVLLGHARPSAYPAGGAPGTDAYMGATCGRYANRIADAVFTLDGQRHRLVANEGRNQRHGGPTGFHQAIWAVADAAPQSLTLRHVSPDGDQGFPGALEVTARFTLTDTGELAIVYTAKTDRPTHVNLASHGYFNLSGVAGTTILDHRLTIAADRFLPINAVALPTGERRPVAGTPFDFTGPIVIGDAIVADDEQLRRGDGFNHNFCLDAARSTAAARLEHAASGRTLSIATDQPGLQFYSGNALGDGFVRHAGLCLETQAWPDSPNRPDFPSTRLAPGQTYRSETRLRFGVIERD